jgi:5-hydroxyisourate hydrolase-like protein (transthyretin family)
MNDSGIYPTAAKLDLAMRFAHLIVRLGISKDKNEYLLPLKLRRYWYEYYKY